MQTILVITTIAISFAFYIMFDLNFQEFGPLVTEK